MTGQEAITRGLCPTSEHPCLTLVTLRDYLDLRFEAAEKANVLLAVSAARERDTDVSEKYALKAEVKEHREMIHRQLEERRQRFTTEIDAVRDRLDKEAMLLHEFKAAVDGKAGSGQMWIATLLGVAALLLSVLDFFLRRAGP
jgi:hypothetical protein